MYVPIATITTYDETVSITSITTKFDRAAEKLNAALQRLA